MKGLRNLNKRKGIDGPIAQGSITVIVFALVLLTMMPLAITIMLSLKTSAEFAQGFWVFPKTPMFSNYMIGFNALARNMLNSVIVCTATAFGVVFLSSISAYVFTRHNFPGKNVLFSAIIALLVVPGILTQTTSFLNVINLGLKDTWWALILPHVAGGQIGTIFMFRTFFGQQPRELYEAAIVDGANDFQMYLNITLPLAVPILVVQAIGSFSGMYNDFLWPTLVIDTPEIQTLMPVLKSLASTAGGVSKEPGAVYASYLVSGIPLIFTSAIGLKYFVNGDFAAGMKL